MKRVQRLGYGTMWFKDGWTTHVFSKILRNKFTVCNEDTWVAIQQHKCTITDAKQKVIHNVKGFRSTIILLVVSLDR